jgi:hypothetical protein
LTPSDSSTVHIYTQTRHRTYITLRILKLTKEHYYVNTLLDIKTNGNVQKGETVVDEGMYQWDGQCVSHNGKLLGTEKKNPLF